MFVTIESLRRHLNIPFTEDDLYLAELEEAAELAIEHRLSCKLTDIVVGGELPADLATCIKFLVGTWYANRESVSYAQPHAVPLTYEYLLQPYINYVKNNPLQECVLGY